MTIGPRLALIPLFEGLSASDLDGLDKVVVMQTMERGQTIFSEGDEGRGFYVVHTGRVKIYKLSPEGKEQILHILGPGQPFGEAAVFAGKAFPAHALALEKGRTLYFPRTAFIDLVKKNPSLALNMLASLSRRLHQFAGLIEALSLKEVPGRLASYLLYLSEKADNALVLKLDISKGQLASLLGTIPETLSRILARMHKQGLIQSDGAEIRILDRDGLTELAAAERRL